MLDDAVSSFQTLHVGDARHEVAGAAQCASGVQNMLLADEDIVEGILFCAANCNAARPSVGQMIGQVTEQIMSVLSSLCSARLVCHAWRSAALRPLLIATLEHELTKLKVASDFMRRRRMINSLGASQFRRCAVNLTPSDMELFRWMVVGYENGFASVVADDDGLQTTTTSGALLRYLFAHGVNGPFWIVAPDARWSEWREAIGEEFADILWIRSEDELHDHYETLPRRLQRPAVMVISSHPRSRAAEGEMDTEALLGLEDCLDCHRSECRLAIFDERHHGTSASTGLTWRAVDFQVYHNGAGLVRLTGERFASDPATLASTWHKLTGIDVFEQRSLGHALEQTFGQLCRGEHAVQLRAWALSSFVVPTLQSALSGVVCSRRVLRGGQPHQVDFELPEHTIVDFDRCSSPFDLVGHHVRLQGLTSKPQYNGRVGYVFKFDDSSGRLWLRLLSDDEKRLPESTCIKVMPELVAIVPDGL